MSDEHEKLRVAIKRLEEGQSAVPHLDFPEAARIVIAAAESTLPKTRMVEVWRVEFAYKPNDVWVPGVNACANEDAARLRSDELRNSKCNDVHLYRTIRVTGPHLQEVPE